MGAVSAEQYLPFNPANSARRGDVNRRDRHFRWVRDSAGGHAGWIVTKTDSRYVYAMRERLLKGMGHFLDKQRYPKGRISARTFLRAYWDISVPNHIPIRIKRKSFCRVQMRIRFQNVGGGYQYFPHRAFDGRNYFDMHKKGYYQSSKIRNCYHIEFGGTTNNFPFLKLKSRKYLVVFNFVMHPKIAVHGTYRVFISFFKKTDYNWFQMGTSWIKWKGQEAYNRMTIKQYYRHFRHTKLYKYGFDNKKDTPVVGSDLRRGTLILGLHKGWWYAGRVASVSGSKVKIRWLDGTVSHVNRRSGVRKYNWGPGTSISCKQPWNKKWKWAEIRSISGERLRVQFRGTDLPVRVPLGDCATKK